MRSILSFGEAESLAVEEKEQRSDILYRQNLRGLIPFLIEAW